MVTLTQLEYLVAVDKHRHFGKAAKASFITQPALSMQILRLEEELGVQVFDRSKQPILPTALGKRVIDQARIAISEFKKLAVVAEAAKTDVSGKYTLAVIPTLSPYLIPLFIGPFAAKYSDVELTIEEMQTSQIIAALEAETIDAGLLATPLGEPGLTEEVLFYEPFYLYVSKDHALAKKAKIREDDLDGNDVWLLKEGHCFRNQVIRVCAAKDQHCVLANVRFESGNLETLMGLVDKNGGYTLVPALAVKLQRERASSPFRLAPFADPIPAREVSLVLSRRSLKRPVHEALKATILSVVPEEMARKKSKSLEVVKIDK